MIQRRVYRMQAGNISNLQISTEQLPDPADDEVQIEVHAIGLNFADLYSIWGMYKAAPKKDFIPGLEYAGIITATGRNITQWQPGDRVFGVTRFGAYVDHLNIDARYISRLPDEWNTSAGAAFPVQAITAYYALVELARAQRGETVLIHSAAGGVGIHANRIAKRLGLYTIGSVGSDRKTELLKQEGYDATIVRSERFAQDLKETLQDRPLNVVLECIGGNILKDGFKALAPEGRMIVYGSASFTTQGDKPNKLKMLWRFLRRPKIDPLLLPNSNKALMGFNLIWLYYQAPRFARILQELMDMKLPAPLIGSTFSFDQLPDAIRALQSGQTTGKVIVGVR